MPNATLAARLRTGCGSLRGFKVQGFKGLGISAFWAFGFRVQGFQGFGHRGLGFR